jgi:acetyl-CoA carboxylase carboxyltransferase component
VAAFTSPDDRACMALLRRLLSYLPLNNAEAAPFVPSDDPREREEPALDSLVPSDPSKPYDMREVVRLVVDRDSFLEVHAAYARNILVGFARLGGYVIGVVANQPAALAGCLDIDASKKGARFIRFCDAFNVPIVTFEDVPGFLPGTEQERNGIILHGAKLLYAYAEATVPKLTVITRRLAACASWARRHPRRLTWPGRLAVAVAAAAPRASSTGARSGRPGSSRGEKRARRGDLRLHGRPARLRRRRDRAHAARAIRWLSPEDQLRPGAEEAREDPL